MVPHGAFASFFQPASFTNGATASGYIDRLVNGEMADYANIALTLSQSNNATNKPSVMKLSHSETTDATNFADITGFVGGTSFTVGNQLTGGSNVHQMNIDLKGKRRYVGVAITPVTTQVISAVAFLGRLKRNPITATEAGTLNFVSG